MSIIKTLILREWFKHLGITTIILYLLVTTANLIAGFLRSYLNIRDIVFNHLVETPGYFKFILPVACLTASLFTINKLKSTNELVAILASGHGRKKFILHIANAAFLVAVAQFFILSYIAPFLKSQRHLLIENPESKFSNQESRGLRASTISSGHIWYKNEQYFFSFEAYNHTERFLVNITAYLYRLLPSKGTFFIEKIIRSPKAVFIPEKGWVMEQVKIIKELHTEGFPQLENHQGEESILSIREGPQDFKRLEADITTLDIVQLFRYIRQLNQNGININEYMILFWEKISIPLTCLIFALLSSISLFRPSRKEERLGRNLFFIFLFLLCYWPINSYFIQLGTSSKLNPFMACFSGPLAFSLLLTAIFYKNRRL